MPLIGFAGLFLGMLVGIVSQSFSAGLVIMTMGVLILMYWFYGILQYLPAAGPRSKSGGLVIMILAVCALVVEAAFASIGYQTDMEWSAIVMVAFFPTLIAYLGIIAIRGRKMPPRNPSLQRNKDSSGRRV